MSVSRIVLLAAAMVATPASAADMAFYLRNQSAGAVAVELHSAARAYSWPGDDKVYRLDKAERKSVPISCEAGERICYGAWVVGDDRTFWGIGPDRDQQCEDCCWICVEKATETVDIGP